MVRRMLLTVLAALLVTGAASAEKTVTLTFGGDCVLGTREEWVGQDDSFDAFIARQGLTWCFSRLDGIFKADDLTMVNLECVLQNGNKGHNNSKQHTFRGLPEYADMFPKAGVELVNLANNHYIDYGKTGRANTKESLEKAGVPYCGYQELYVAEIGGVKIGFGGCRETVYEKSKPTVYRDIQELKKRKCDVIIYSCHWGTEYSAQHNKKQESMARYAVNSGADILVGTHPHVVQGITSITADDGSHSAAVIYSLGNLVFGGTKDMTTFDAMLVRATLRFDEDNRYLGVSVDVIPVQTSSTAPFNDFRPVIAMEEGARRILKQVQADSTVDVSRSAWISAHPQGDAD